MVVRYPLSSGNRKFHHRLKYCLIIGVWLLASLTSLPVLLIRKEENITLLQQQFTFCLEQWPSEYPSLRKVYSAVVFITVYLLPCTILLYCQLTVGYLIRSYEKRTAKTNPRRSFNRRGFRARSSASTSATEDFSTMVSDQVTSDVYGSDGMAARRRMKSLNKKRKRIARLIIWTTIGFVLCWLVSVQ